MGENFYKSTPAQNTNFGVRADVQHLIETYAPTTVRVEKEVNWNRSKYRCYDVSGDYLGGSKVSWVIVAGKIEQETNIIRNLV